MLTINIRHAKNNDTTLILESGESIQYINYNLNWTEGPIDILGLPICKIEIESIKYNLEPKIKK